VAFVMAASVHPGSSAVVMFTTKEHLASASEIGGVAIASASACDSSVVA
jgi:hypothetical protein